MDRTAVLIIAGFVLLFSGVCVYAMRSSAKGRARKADAARAAGFTPVPSPPAEISARIFDLYARPGRTRFRLQNVSQKSFPDGEMFLFDLEETSGEDTTSLATQDVLFVSRNLRLPRFSLIPKLEAGGKLGKAANRVLQWAADRQGLAVEPLGHEEFDRRYWVSAPDLEAMRGFLLPDRVERLASTQTYALEAGGDAFAFSHRQVPKLEWANASPGVPELNEKIRGGMQLFNWLASSDEGSPGRTPPTELSSEWSRAAEDEWVKPAPGAKVPRIAAMLQSIGCMLPFGVIWTLFSATFLVVGMATYSNERRTYDLLKREGVRSIATVTEYYTIRDDEEGTTYYAGYTYHAPVSGAVTQLSSTEGVSRDFYDGLEKGMGIEIRYAESQPEISRIEAGFSPPGLMLPVCFGGMGSVFTLIGLGLIGGALRSTWQALKKRGGVTNTP